jgi:hypothetical protein
LPTKQRWKIDLSLPAGNEQMEQDITPYILFAFRQNWRGKPLISHEVIIDFITATTTGLTFKKKPDTDVLARDSRVPIQQMAELQLRINIVS